MRLALPAAATQATTFCRVMVLSSTAVPSMTRLPELASPAFVEGGSPPLGLGPTLVTAAWLSLTSARGQCVPPSDFEASRTSVADVDRRPPSRRGGHAPPQRGHVERGSWRPGEGHGHFRV